MMRRCAALLAAGVLASGVAAQQATEAPSPEASAAPDAVAYDPTAFLEAMVSYRTLALTCEDTLPGSPMADSAEIGAFFQTLGMTEPLALDPSLNRLTLRLVRAQGASVCTERLQESATLYGRSAVEYSQSKPDAWPEAPRISAGPWCASLSCAELSF